MHELAIAQSLLNTISSWRDQHNGAKVLSARIEVGRLGGVDPEALQFAWEAACEFVSGGRLKDCRLEIELLPLHYHCGGCGEDFETETLTDSCPACGRKYPERLGGKELNLKSLEVE
ncbi:MAG: hydrogenase maturation nickel metallochaperone HypA [Lentisphaeria bacterium]|nr:hydrogenase maturation nickel metallochaperone HypA [Lentisphaeria bacterium]